MQTRLLSLLLVLVPALPAIAQLKPLATVSQQDATVDTAPGQQLAVSSDRLMLVRSATVRARQGRNAEVLLSRGGTILVCQTSPLHLAGTPDALAIGLDRGALEIHTKATASDAILTPDLRITAPVGGLLDLRLRVSPNGDTCVENRGRKAPVLVLSDAFGETSYQIKPGQHVLFERGSLKAVVDRETTPCGCPPADHDAPKAVPLAEALLHGNDAKVTPQQSAAANPFPVAQSEGMAPPAPLPPDKPGETHTQVSTTLNYDPTTPKAPALQEAESSAPAPPQPSPAETKGGPFRAVGRFFKRIFLR